MMRKSIAIVIYTLPLVPLIGLIPLVHDDGLLAVIYGVCIVLLLIVRREKNDILVLAVGCTFMTAAEYFFIKTGVETFLRRSLLGVMPLWLPVLWGYAFVTMKRVIRVLDTP